MLPILNIGPLAVQTPGLILLLGIWIGTVVVERNAERHGVNPSKLNSMIFIGLIAGILGARLLYALRFLDIYLEDPLGLISLNPSTLAPLEGAVVGILAAIIYAANRKMRLWPTLDALTIGFAVFTIALGFSHLASGDAFGSPADLPWSIELWGARRHPTQLYEILAVLLILGLILLMRERRYFSGFLFLFWLGLYASSVLVIEAFRGDSQVVLGSLRQAQLIGLLIVTASMLILYTRAHRTQRD